VRLWSPVDTVDYYNYAQPNVTLEKDGAQGAGVTSGGVFAQDVICLGRQVSLTAGVRVDRAEIFEGDTPDGEDEIRETRKAISASAGMVYAPSAAHAFTLNVGRAFRMPDAVDMFTEQVTCQGTLAPNPDLNPEYSVNFDAGYRGRMKGFAWDISLFLNQYSDLIVKTVNPEDTSESMMANEDYARIMGGELELSYEERDLFPKGCSVRAGCSVSYCAGDSFDDGDGQWDIASSGEPLSGIPPARIRPNVRVSYAAAERKYFLEVEVDNSLEKTRIPDELGEATWKNEDVDAYSLVNLSAGVALFNYACLEEVRFNVSVSNAFDTRYYPFGSHIPGRGRDIRMLLSFAY
jgi:outer membrane receptor protein involved in Fe transport